MITTAVDVLWIMFWLPYYNDREIAKFNYGLHMFVCVVSMVEIALKVIIFFMLFASKGNMKSSSFGRSNGNGGGNPGRGYNEMG